MTHPKRPVRILPPEDFLDLRLSDPADKAGGVPAVTNAFKHVMEETGFLKGMKLLMHMNQKDGFDCPGCAWPDPEHRSGVAEYCENGAKALAEEATDKRLDGSFFRKHSVEEMSRWSDYEIGKAGRLVQPLYLAADSSHYKPLGWPEAFEILGSKLKSLDSPDEAVFYTSGRTSNEAAFLYQLFVRQYGTNNMPDCSNMCHESSGVGLKETLGIGKGSVTLEDIHAAELILVIGQNPGTNHPRMLSALKKCKQNGGKIIHVNPIPEAGLKKFSHPQDPMDLLNGGQALADLYIQVRINGDVAFLKGIMKLLRDMEQEDPGSAFDHTFIREKTAGFETLDEDLARVDIEECLRLSGVSTGELSQAAEMVASHSKIIICWAMGLTQHRNGVENIREVVNLLLLRGAIGKPGAGTCPVRGHSNVQGDRTVGIVEKPSEAFLKALDKHFGIRSPREHGYDTVHAIEAMEAGKVKVFMGMGGNFISATPDSERTGRAMQNCELSVQVSTKLNRAHLVTGREALILPCLSRSERDMQPSGQQFVTVENSMGIVHSSRGDRKPASAVLLSEPAIVAGIARATFGDQSPVNWATMVNDYDNVREAIEAVIPGFDDYNLRVREPGGFSLPNCAREGWFDTPDGKAQFTINPLPDNAPAEGHFVLMTIRSHDQFNTTIYGLDDRYRGIYNERRVLLMNRRDMAIGDFYKGQVVHLKSHFKGSIREAHNFRIIPYDIAQGCLAAYFPETNNLVPLEDRARGSHTPASKFVEVSVIKAEDAAPAL